MFYHPFLESSQGFVTHSQHLFEFTHQWLIKGCSDDRGSIKSRSLADEGGERNNMKIGRMAGSQVPPDSETESCCMFARPCLALSEPDNQPERRGRQPTVACEHRRDSGGKLVSYCSVNIHIHI